MFRYLARRHDRKHMLKSLDRQRRIGHKSIAFGFDAQLAFPDRAAGAQFFDQDEWQYIDISEAEEFFSPTSSHKPLADDGDRVVFRSDIETADDENNTFECVVTRARPQRDLIVVSKRQALVVFHHWYARHRYKRFAEYFASRGITVVEATLPYHFSRGNDDDSEEKLINANLGRTVRSMRQAVLDGRKIVRWLNANGYETISVAGMCIGGTIAGLVAAYEHKVDKAALLVAPASLADVVWTGETLKRLRNRIEPFLSFDELKIAWGMINLDRHSWGLTRPGLDLLFVIGSDDTITRPGATDGVIEFLTNCMRAPSVVRLNCGHSSLGIFPYNLLAARKVLHFLKETPSLAELWEVRGFRYNFSEL